MQQKIENAETSADVYIQKTSGIKFIDKIGYALGDFACLMSFGLVTSILQTYYTDVLKIDPGWLMILFTVARLWDAVNDTIWGRVVDSKKVGTKGRYRPWLIWMSVPLALSTVLMFIKIPGMSVTGYFAFATVTYVVYGMLYTAVNIPYGSLASVITTKEKERSSLSVFRAIGSGLGGLPAIFLSSFCMVKIIVDGREASEVNYPRLIIGVSIMAVLSVIGFYLSYRWTKERVQTAPPAVRQKGETAKIIKALFKSKPFVVICAASMLMIAGQMFTQSYYLYLFKNYFNAPELYLLVTVTSYAPMVLLILFAHKIIAKTGKKEICALGMLLAGVANFVLFFLKTTNPYVFLSMCLFCGIGSSFFLLQVWALVTDTIDYNEVKTGVREDATSYAFYSFTRKLGHTIAALLANAALIW
ncbi:MAG: MFS transporter, partial [Clostridia bacterium]|nr:MFS transporter [Clostridia bacterium]